jgi:predicted transcriptional regulator
MVKKDLPPLSPTETEILRTVWQLDKAAVQEVYENFPKKRKISFTTVQTLLRRLEKKGYLKHKVRGNANIYYAAVNMESVLKRTVNDFLERVFGGDPVPLMMYLAKHGKVTTQDIKKLIKLIEEE